MMVRKSYLTILWAFLFLSTSTLFSQEFNNIDAVSSASGKLQVIGGKVYSDRAEIVWRDGYTNGEEHTLKWGESESFGNNINLKPFTKNQNTTTVIEGLKAGTSYFGQFYRTYEGKIKKTNFVFQTTDGTDVIKDNVNKLSKNNKVLKIESIRIVDGTVNVMYENAKPGNVIISIFNVNGKEIANKSIYNLNSGKTSEKLMIDSKSISSGVYIVAISNNSSHFTKRFNVFK